MSNQELQDVHELCNGVSFLDDDLLGPVGEHGVAVFHAEGHGRGENLERLPDNIPSLNSMGLQKTVEHLQHDPLVDGELGDDVAKQEMSVVPRRRIDAVLTEQARPCECHEASKFVTLTLVGSVVDVLRRLFDEQAAQL